MAKKFAKSYLRVLTNILFELQILTNAKLKEISVPYYDNLSLEIMREWAETYHKEVFSYLPEESEFERLPRYYVCNILHSVIGDAFKKFVGDKIKERNTNIVKKLDLAVNIQPEILKAIRKTDYISGKFDKNEF